MTTHTHWHTHSTHTGQTHMHSYLMQSSRQLHITYTLCQLRKKSGRSQCIFASLNWRVICLPSWARLQLLLLLFLLTIEPSAEPSFCSGKWAVNQLLNLLLYGLLSWLWLPTVEGGEWRRDRFHYNAACVTPLANSTGVGVAGSGHSTVLRLSVCLTVCSVAGVKFMRTYELLIAI